MRARVAAIHDHDGDPQALREERDVDDPEPCDRDPAEDHAAEAAREAQPRDPVGEEAGGAVAVHREARDGDPLDEVAALHHHADDRGVRARPLLERPVVDADPVRPGVGRGAAHAHSLPTVARVVESASFEVRS
jgi:hypothetical protein